MDREERYATQVVDRMLKETRIDTSHEDPSQWNIYAPHMGRWISPLGFISPNNRHWSAFEDHVMDIYGVDWELVGTIWNTYLKVITKSFRQLAGKAMGNDTPPWDMQYDYLAEGLTNQKYLHKVLNRLVDETDIKMSPYNEPIAYPTWIVDDSEGVDLGVLLDSGLDHWNFKEFSEYVRNMYGLTKSETMDIWEPYADRLDTKYQSLAWTTNYLNENLNSKIHKAVNDTFKKNKGLKGQHRITRYFMKQYGLDKWEADQAMVQYLSKQQSLNEGRSKEEMDYYIQKAKAKYQKFYDGIIDRLVDGTKIRVGQYGGSASQEPMEMPFIKPPFLYYDSKSPTRNLLHSEIPVSEIENYYSDFLNYIRSIYEVPEDEIKKLFKPFLVKLMDKVENEMGETPVVNESVDLSYTDDEDFPFLNKVANHALNITEISRNAVMFPFIDGYISDGNFHKYFNSVPIEDIPFEASLKVDEYLNLLGLTENEKGIWWDIYINKVRDAVYERDLRIIDSHGELYESTRQNINI